MKREWLMVLGLKYIHESKKALTLPPELFTDRESAIQYGDFIGKLINGRSRWHFQ
jgi:hypothetical protein